MKKRKPKVSVLIKIFISKKFILFIYNFNCVAGLIRSFYTKNVIKKLPEFYWINFPLFIHNIENQNKNEISFTVHYFIFFK